MVNDDDDEVVLDHFAALGDGQGEGECSLAVDEMFFSFIYETTSFNKTWVRF